MPKGRRTNPGFKNRIGQDWYPGKLKMLYAGRVRKAQAIPKARKEKPRKHARAPRATSIYSSYEDF